MLPQPDQARARSTMGLRAVTICVTNWPQTAGRAGTDPDFQPSGSALLPPTGPADTEEVTGPNPEAPTSKIPKPGADSSAGPCLPLMPPRNVPPAWEARLMTHKGLGRFVGAAVIF